MKLFGKLLIAALVIAILLPFTILKGKDGKPLMNLSSLKLPKIGLPDLPSLPESATSGMKSEADGEETVIYQWKDSTGSIQFTNIPPPEGVEYTVKGYNPDANVIQSVKLPEAYAAAVEPEEKTLETCRQAETIVNELDELVEAGFKGREVTRVEEMIASLARIESDTDHLAEAATRRVFALESELGVSTVYWWHMVDWVSELADAAEKIGNRLRLLIAS